jgi:hypothetical protein
MAGTISGGTVDTMYTMLDIPRSERRTDEWQFVTPYHKPSARPKTVYKMVIDGTLRYGGFFFMYPYNRLIVRRSYHLSRIDSSLYSKHEEEERYPLRSKGKGKGRISQAGGSDPNIRAEPVHGDRLHYEEAIVMPNQITAFIFSFTVFSFFALFFTSRIVSHFHPWRILR